MPLSGSLIERLCDAFEVERRDRAGARSAAEYLRGLGLDPAAEPALGRLQQFLAAMGPEPEKGQA